MRCRRKNKNIMARKNKTVKKTKRSKIVKRARKTCKKNCKSRRKKSIKKVSRLSKHSSFLRKLFTTSDPVVQKNLIKNASKGEILALTEFVYNILRQNIPLTSDQKRALCQHKKNLLMVTNRGVPCEQKRKIFLKSQQEGGIIGLIASVAIPLISSLISAFTGK
jgi:hypothetical protein